MNEYVFEKYDLVKRYDDEEGTVKVSYNNTKEEAEERLESLVSKLYLRESRKNEGHFFDIDEFGNYVDYFVADESDRLDAEKTAAVIEKAAGLKLQRDTFSEGFTDNTVLSVNFKEDVRGKKLVIKENGSGRIVSIVTDIPEEFAELDNAALGLEKLVYALGLCESRSYCPAEKHTLKGVFDFLERHPERFGASKERQECDPLTEGFFQGVAKD
jgi:hypothetical protein